MTTTPATRPPYSPEIFVAGKGFQSLSSMQDAEKEALKKPLALFNVAENHDSLFEFGSEVFTIARINESDRDKLISNIDTLKESLPKLPLLHLSLKECTNSSVIEINKRGEPVLEDESIGKITQRVDSLGTIAVWNSRTEKNKHLVEAVSRNANGHCVLGPSDCVQSYRLSILDKIPLSPILVPSFGNGSTENVIMCRNGTQIASCALKNIKDLYLIFEGLYETNSRLYPESLNEQLHKVAGSASRSLTNTYYLLAIKANVNVLDNAKKSPLQTAIENKNFQTGRILIDNGAFISPEIQSNLEQVLTGLKVSTRGIELFQIKRPPRNSLEVFVPGKGFQPLSEMTRQDRSLLMKPIAFFNIADENNFNENYGSVTNKFSKAYDYVYEFCSKSHTVVRVLIDDRNKLVSNIEKVKALLPGLSLLHWSLDGHANQTMVELGGDGESCFSWQDVSIMHEIAKHVHELGTLALLGCRTAEDEKNFIRSFAKHAHGRCVIGSSDLVDGVDYRRLVTPSGPVLVPEFLSHGGTKNMTIYRNKTAIVSGNPEDQDVSSRLEIVFEAIARTYSALEKGAYYW